MPPRPATRCTAGLLGEYLRNAGRTVSEKPKFVAPMRSQRTESVGRLQSAAMPYRANRGDCTALLSRTALVHRVVKGESKGRTRNVATQCESMSRSIMESRDGIREKTMKEPEDNMELEAPMRANYVLPHD